MSTLARLRPLIAGSVIVLLAACGSGGDGTGPTITATLPSDASIVRPTDPPGTVAPAPPAETQPVPPAEEAAPPAESAPPEEAAPPAETAPPEAPPEATAAPDATTAGDAAPEDDEGGTVWWPWALAAVIVLIGVIAALARRRRPGPSWQIRVTTLLDGIEQLTSHLAAVTPGGLHAVAQSDAMRLATMRATLRDLIESAPDTASQAALNGLTTPIAQLHGAVDAIAMSADPSIQPDGVSVAQLATQLHTASASARAYLAIPR